MVMRVMSASLLLVAFVPLHFTSATAYQNEPSLRDSNAQTTPGLSSPGWEKGALLARNFAMMLALASLLVGCIMFRYNEWKENHNIERPCPIEAQRQDNTGWQANGEGCSGSRSNNSGRTAPGELDGQGLGRSLGRGLRSLAHARKKQSAPRWARNTSIDSIISIQSNLEESRHPLPEDKALGVEGPSSLSRRRR